MERSYPIFTEQNECQDCYKCLRQCPVKAIKVTDGHASVMEDLCVICGRCVDVCPAKAKKIRQELGRARELIRVNKKVIASLAPSWKSEYPEITESMITVALKKLGFFAVSETALGAEIVTENTAKILQKAAPGIYWSSACPAVTDFLEKYAPVQVDNITKLHSPVIAHTKFLRDFYGADCEVIMIGPCIAKKKEADRYNKDLAIALTFNDLNVWMEEKSVSFKEISFCEENQFMPYKAEQGKLYPVEGGMIESLRKRPELKDVNFVTLTGINMIDRAINGRESSPKNVVFIESLACEGGCVNGPGTKRRDGGLNGQIKVFDELAESRRESLPEEILKKDISAVYEINSVAEYNPTEVEIKKVLKSIGKDSKKDELNCGGCGYDSCRNFARARILNKAEDSMCLSYLRKQYQKKANALIRCIPGGVVIIDNELKIIESNRNFAVMFGGECETAYDACPGLAGASLKRILSFTDLFESVLENSKDVLIESFKYQERLLNIHIFNIETSKVIGALIFDVTKTEIKREKIAARAKEVINKNLNTVQEIACMLGEHMAETEILLRSIAEDFPEHNQTMVDENE